MGWLDRTQTNVSGTQPNACGESLLAWLEPDFAAELDRAAAERRLEQREVDETEIAAILRDKLKALYGYHVEEPKEPAAVTRAKYLKEFSSFALWCAGQGALPEIEPPKSLPAKPELVASYLHSLIENGAKEPVCGLSFEGKRLLRRGAILRTSSTGIQCLGVAPNDKPRLLYKGGDWRGS